MIRKRAALQSVVRQLAASTCMFALAASPACQGGGGGDDEPTDPPDAVLGGFEGGPPQGSSSTVPDFIDPDDYIDPTTRVGSLGGTLSVRENGESAYSIPIQTPPGRGGVQPSLGLVYSSNGGTREAGKGWSISGQSAIARCPGMIPFSSFGAATAALGLGDGIFPSATDPNDFHTLCLDGQLMIPMNDAGTEFVLAGTSQVAVTADFPTGLNGPGTFIAAMPDGSTQVYTGQVGSRVKAGSTLAAQTGNHVDRVRRWPMTERSDSTGNSVAYTYAGTEDVPSMRGGVTADHRLTRIDYNGGEIVFHYEANPTDEAADPGDQRVWFWNGARTEELAYLRGIEIRGAMGGLARTYQFDYTRSPQTGDLLLRSAERCDREGVCAPATTFDYTEGGGGLEAFELDHGVNGGAVSLNERELETLTQADLNHDGRPDLLYITDRQATETVAIMFSESRTTYAEPWYLATFVPEGARLSVSDLDGDGYLEPTLIDTSTRTNEEDVTTQQTSLYYGYGVPRDRVIRIELSEHTGHDSVEAVTEAQAGNIEDCVRTAGFEADCDVIDFLDVVLYDVDADGTDEILACQHSYDAWAGTLSGIGLIDDPKKEPGPGDAYWTIVYGDQPFDTGQQVYTSLPCGTGCAHGECDRQDGYDFADVTGDGRLEFLRLGPVDDELGDQVALLGNPLGTGLFPHWVFGPGFVGGGGYFNGGPDEQRALPGSLFQRYNERRGGSTSETAGRPYGAGAGMWLDVNGDGLLDQVRFEPQASGDSIDNQWSELDIYVWACVDGEPEDEPFEAGVGVFLNRGDGSFEHRSHAAPFSAWTDYCDRFQDAVSVDVDGDRVAELVIPDPSTGQADVASFSNGARSVEWSTIAWGGEDDDDKRRTFAFDIGGSGSSGLLVAHAPVNDEYALEGYWRPQVPDLLTRVTDGYGGQSEVEYGSLYDGVYDGGTSDEDVFRSVDCPDGFVPMAPNWPLVKSIRTFEGADEGAIDRHRYTGLCREARGRSPVTFEQHETSTGWWKSSYELATTKNVETRGNYGLEFGQAVYRGMVTEREAFSATGNGNRYERSREYTSYVYIEDYFDRSVAQIELGEVAVGKVVVDRRLYDAYSHEGTCDDLGSFSAVGDYPCSLGLPSEQTAHTESVVVARNNFGTPTEVHHRRGDLCTEETWNYSAFEHSQRLTHSEVRSGKIATEGVGEWTCDLTSPDHSPYHRSVHMTYNPGVPDDPWLVDTKTVGSEGETHVVTDYGYDDAGQLTSIAQSAGGPDGDAGTDGSDRTWSRTFDGTGIFERTRTNGLGHTSGVLWHPDLAVPVASTDVNGVITFTRYDGMGRATGGQSQLLNGDWTELAPPSEVRYERVVAAGAASGEPSPLRLVSVDPSGLESFVEYDTIGRQVYSEWDVDAQTRAFSRTTRTMSSPGFESWAQRVDTTLPAKVGDADGAASTIFIDGLGRVVETQPAAADIGPTQYRYEGRQSIVVGPEAGSQRVSTTSMGGILETVVDAEGIVTCYYHGAEGRPRDIVVNPASGTCDGSIPDDGPERSSTHFRYNKAGQVVSRHLAGRSEELTEYNAFGEPWRVQDASGTSTFAFDRGGRIISRTDSAVGTATYEWDSDADCAWADGYLRRTTSADGAVREYVYDAFGRVQQSSLDIDGVSFALDYRYDDFSRLAQLRHLGGPTIERSYDEVGALSSVSAQGVSLWTADARNALGAIEDAHYGNGVQENHLYVEGLLRESHLMAPNMTPPYPGAGFSTVEVDSQSLFYDQNGRISVMEIPHLSLREKYRHDRLGRLEGTEMYRQGTLVDDFEQTYWPTGAIDSRSGVGTYKYESQVAPLGVSQAGLLPYTYDADGRQTSRGGYAFTWNQRGRLLTATDGTNSVLYNYDASDNRVRKDDLSPSGIKSTFYGDMLEYEVDGADEQVTYFVPGESGHVAALRRTPGQDDYSVLYLHSTHNGSASVVTDEAGAVVERQDFDAFGRKRPLEWAPGGAMTGNEADIDIGFTGHRKVESYGLIDMGGRHYDPHLGRFASPDPILAAPGSSQGYDPFAYVFNDPLSFTDPSGFSANGDTCASSKGGCDFGVMRELINPFTNAPPRKAPKPPIILSLSQVFGGVDADVDTEASGDGAAGESEGAERIWQGTGLPPATVERTKTELPKIPVPSFEPPPSTGSFTAYLNWGASNAMAASYGWALESTNVGISMVEGVLNVGYHAERAGVFAGRAAVGVGRAWDNGNLWSWHSLMNIADDVAVASGEVGHVVNAVTVVGGGVGAAADGVAGRLLAANAAKRGTATVLDHGGTHASIIVRQGETVLHTEQIVNSTTKATTIVEVANPGAVKGSYDIALPDAAGALRHQRAALGQPGGTYDVIRNSCVTHCGDVLRAGGVEGAPTTTLDIVRWLRSL